MTDTALPFSVGTLPAVFCDPPTAESQTPIVPLRLIKPGEALPPWADTMGFQGASGTLCIIPAADGTLAEVLVGMGDGSDMMAVGDVSGKLPPGVYGWTGFAAREAETAQALALGWAFGAYSFDRYKNMGQKDASDTRKRALLCWPEGADRAVITAHARATTLVRDLINIPAADLGPQELQEVAAAVAEHHGATFSAIIGEDLLREGYPAIYGVGVSSPRPPRLLDLTWGHPDAPKVTLVGKGVVFDTGGLDIKPPSAMRLMKKDMGGAAHVLGLAWLVMALGLSVRLRVLIPVAENAVSGLAMRPGDILNSRKGLTIEVNNTDAEGRLILADALTEGDSEEPEVLIDYATLTGAARSALGPDIPALFSTCDQWAQEIVQAGLSTKDPLWQLPLWPGYRSKVKGRVGDVDNSPEGGMGGAITAALFLEHFITPERPWVHIDTYGWCQSTRPGHPMGGDALGVRAVFKVLQDRFG